MVFLNDLMVFFIKDELCIRKNGRRYRLMRIVLRTELLNIIKSDYELCLPLGNFVLKRRRSRRTILIKQENRSAPMVIL